MVNFRTLSYLIIVTILVTPSSAWSPQTSLQLASDAQQLMPTTMKLLIERNWSYLLQGITEAVSVHCPHSELPGRIVQEAQSTTNLLNKQKPFSEIFFKYGYMAELVQRINDPFMRSDQTTNHQRFQSSYSQFVERNLANFRIYFKGFAGPAREFTDIEIFTKRSMAKAGFYLPHLAEAYNERVQVDPSLTFDERSIPFGVSALLYNNAMLDLATVWIIVWNKGGGDLSGMKYRWTEAEAVSPSSSDVLVTKEPQS